MIIKDKRCVIVTAYSQYTLKSFWEFNQEDFIICADGGLDLIEKYDVKPDVIIGDFDSVSKGGKGFDENCWDDVNIIRVKAEKDETDTFLCVKYALDHGYSNLILLGGIGGRFDHTFANLQVLSFFLDETLKLSCEKKISIIDRDNVITLIENEPLILYKKDYAKWENVKFSIFSWGEKATGIKIVGAKYPLENAALTNSFPIGVSNEFEKDSVEISCKTGRMLIIVSNE